MYSLSYYIALRPDALFPILKQPSPIFAHSSAIQVFSWFFKNHLQKPNSFVLHMGKNIIAKTFSLFMILSDFPYLNTIFLIFLINILEKLYFFIIEMRTKKYKIFVSKQCKKMCANNIVKTLQGVKILKFLTCVQKL